jgi:Transposase DDE domain
MRNSNQPPLRLRLVKIRLGKTTAWMLTNVLDRAKLTNKQIIRFYKMRWGVEIEFRGLKQTLDRSRLRCRNDRRLLAELDWSIMAMAVAELFALKEQLSHKQPKQCRAAETTGSSKRSLAKAMRAIRYCMRHPDKVPTPERQLQAALRAAVTDSYQRRVPKRARYAKPNPDKKPLGDPTVRKITAEERERLDDFAPKVAA